MSSVSSPGELANLAIEIAFDIRAVHARKSSGTLSERSLVTAVEVLAHAVIALAADLEELQAASD